MKYIYILLLTICFGCSTKNINYDRNKIIEKYNTDYKFFLNDEEIVFKNFFLNKNNINRIIVDKKSKTVNIHQKYKSNLYKLNEYNLNRFINEFFELNDLNCQNCFLFIDGFPSSVNRITELSFEENTIKNIVHLKETNLDKTALIITTNDM